MAISFGSFGKGLKTGLGKLGKDAMRVSSFVRDKALPVVSKVAEGVSKGIKMGLPVLGAVAPELLPLAYGASKVAGLVGKGADITRKGITQGQKVISSLEKGDIVGATKQGKELRNTAISLRGM